jgi:Chaperone of endosialidase
MSSLPLMRTEYWNVGTGTIRTGATAHGESVTDVENYLLPLSQMTASGFYTWGVVAGLTVSAVSGQPGLTIAPGLALDVAGHVLALASGGSAVVDPATDPTQIQSIATVPVGASGVALSTDGISGDCLLTLTFVEALGQSALGNAPILVHAPWLRLLPVANFQDTGEQVILVLVTLDANGNVTALSAGPNLPDGTVAPGRQIPATHAAGITLRCTSLTSSATGLTVGDVAAGQLLADGATTVRLAATDPAGVLELVAGQGPGAGVTAVAGQLTVHTAADTAGTQAITLDATDSSVTAGVLRLGGTQPGVSLSTGAAGGLQIQVTDPASSVEISAGQGNAAELSLGVNQVALRRADGSAAIILDTANTQVGIGTATPQNPLGIRGSGAAEELVSFENPQGETKWQINQNPGGTNPGLNIVETDAGDSRLFVQAGVNMGVNTASPTNPLHVSGNGGIRQNYLYISGGPGWSSLSYNAHHNENNSNWVFPDPSRPAVTVEMDDSGAVPRFQVWSTTTQNTTGWIERFVIDGDTGNVGVGPGVPSFALDVKGTVCAQQFCNPSDLRLKQDITPLADVLGRLADIRAVRYRPINAGASERSGAQIGVLAQDVEAAFPELVLETEPDGLKAVDYAGLSGVLVGAVQELMASNAALAARLDELEPRLDSPASGRARTRPRL